jgi:hypothetical protein
VNVCVICWTVVGSVWVCGSDETGLQHTQCQLSEGACAWGCLLLTQASKDALSHMHCVSATALLQVQEQRYT